MEKMEENKFLKRNAAEYVERLGVEQAIEKLSVLAKKNGQAHKMLNIIVDNYIPKKPEAVKYVERNVSYVPRPRPTLPQPLTPKQRYLNIIEKAKLSFDTTCDENWNPIVSVQWRRGSAMLNGKKVIFPKEYAQFMFGNVARHGAINFKMTVLAANDNSIIVAPDVDDYYTQRNKMYKRIAKEKERERNGFEVVVKMVNGNMKIDAKGIEKDIVIPERYQGWVKKVPGIWNLEVLGESSWRIIAKPNRCLKPETQKRNSCKFLFRDKSRGFVDNRGRIYATKELAEEMNRIHARMEDGRAEKLSEERLNSLYQNGSIKL